ncbi:putrescine/spermidine ABC transporter ATP-binding protein [Rickettsiella grylli]|uniref:spermidine/putrescine ABC transporter ATP-binding protein PotA n=1 Tax=Rickettsiella grylli TaxID=59196 RepID=UPI0008FD07A5|nr:spermidine/putrescine ABC transporter ATP-binding protein PotA [Rickettsiella grylli]OJA00172.1 putrescine/spermidine ABC transporter ATP-binding protein [Rickettsiella grylli]
MSEVVLELKEVSKRFDGEEVLENINFKVKYGEFLTLLGASGCGKTTLLRLISGFEQPDSGVIFINGIDVKGLSPQARHVNTVFQSYALFPHLTVFDNIAFGLRCKGGLSKTEIKQEVDDVLARVKLSQLGQRKPHQLSGGQQQRVAIARAIVNKPSILLLDEPLSSLDYRLRKTMQLELKQLQIQLGITFIFVTHDQEEALSMSDRVVVMHEGNIEQIGTPREVYEEPQSLRVARFIGEVNIFETQILSADEHVLHVMIEGKTFTLKNRHHFSKDQKVYTLVRPEDLEVWSPAEVTDTAQMFPGVVEQVIYKGSTVDLMIRLESQHLLAATQFFNEDDEKLDFHSGESVWVHWIPGWEVILDENGSIQLTVSTLN